MEDALSDAAILAELFPEDAPARGSLSPKPSSSSSSSSDGGGSGSGAGEGGGGGDKAGGTGPQALLPRPAADARRILSVDMGARHLAVAILDARSSTQWRLQRWGVFDVVSAMGHRDMDTTKVPVETLLDILGQYLATAAWREFIGPPGTVDVVAIEQQPLAQATGNRFASGREKTIRMHSLACGLAVWLRAYFTPPPAHPPAARSGSSPAASDSYLGRVPHVRFIPAAQKISDLPRLLQSHGIAEPMAALREGAYASVRRRHKDTDTRIQDLLTYIAQLAAGTVRSRGISKSEKDKRYRQNKAAAVAAAMALLDHLDLRGWLAHLEGHKGKWDDYADALCQALAELPHVFHDVAPYMASTAARRSGATTGKGKGRGKGAPAGKGKRKAPGTGKGAEKEAAGTKGSRKRKTAATQASKVKPRAKQLRTPAAPHLPKAKAGPKGKGKGKSKDSAARASSQQAAPTASMGMVAPPGVLGIGSLWGDGDGSGSPAPGKGGRREECSQGGDEREEGGDAKRRRIIDLSAMDADV